jgi:hypothetical protein
MWTTWVTKDPVDCEECFSYVHEHYSLLPTDLEVVFYARHILVVIVKHTYMLMARPHTKVLHAYVIAAKKLRKPMA